MNMRELSLMRNTCPSSLKWVRITDDATNTRYIVQTEDNTGKVLGLSPFTYTIGDEDNKMSVLTSIVEGYYHMGFKHLRYAPKEGEFAECYKIFRR